MGALVCILFIEHNRCIVNYFSKLFDNLFGVLMTVAQGPILSSSVMVQTSIEGSLHSPTTRANESDLQLPLWVRSAAKLLNGGSEGQDWVALAKRLGKWNAGMRKGFF
jgi:hypothetical protein